jgi:hypothetical protein
MLIMLLRTGTLAGLTFPADALSKRLICRPKPEHTAWKLSLRCKPLLESKPVSKLVRIDSVFPAHGCFLHPMQHRRCGHTNREFVKDLFLEFMSS